MLEALHEFSHFTLTTLYGEYDYSQESRRTGHTDWGTSGKDFNVS